MKKAGLCPPSGRLPVSSSGAALLFGHGFNVHFNLLEPSADLDVLMIAERKAASPI
jgi:ketol-acid reductoisomerase